jgi:DNA-binding transcriptional regulator YdaS (Cro superfamily)
MWRKELRKAINLAGSQTKLAKQIGTQRRVVNNWLNLGINVPLKYAFLIEIKSKGEILAEKISPHESTEILSIKNHYGKSKR